MDSAQRDEPSIRPIRIMFLGLLVFTLAFASLICHFTYIVPEETRDRFFTIVTSVTYENRGNETKVWSFTQDDRTIGLFMNNTWQTVFLANISYQIERVENDDDGNLVAYMYFPKSGISFGENLSYEVAYRVVLKPRSIPEISEKDSQTLDDINKNLKALYCDSTGSWQVNDPNLRKLAYEIAGNETKVLTIVKEFIVWIKKNIVYGTLEVPRYPNETLSGRVGDCDDQANVLITLCRVVGIPAYLQIGCIFMPDKPVLAEKYWNGHLISKLTRIGWHGWAVVYIPPWGWLPVDLTYVRGDLSIEPFNAIKTSAIIAYPTVQYLNVTKTDYVAASRNLRNFLIAHEFYIYEHDIMSEENAKEIKEKPIQGFQPQLVVLIPVFRVNSPPNFLNFLQFMANVYKWKLL